MKKAVFFSSSKACMQFILILAIACLSFGAGSVNPVHASALANTDSCGQQLADAKAKFLALLPADGSIPATSEVKAAAAEYIHVSKLCYDQIQANNSSATLQTETPSHIDDGGMIPGNNTASANFQTTGSKWSSSTITYSFMGSGISFSSEGYGNSVAISALPGFQACFITDIQSAFAAWQAVANVHFQMVSDNGAAFSAPGATGDIRIAAHAFDGPYGILAHAYFPAPSGYTHSDAGDMHFDSAENWTCNTSGIDIGMVALHEIGHSLGLDHQTAPPTAVMNPTYNPSLTGLQSDDIAGIQSLYGTSAALVVPGNDNITNATTIPGISYTNSLNIDLATQDTNPDPLQDPDNIGPCTDTSQHFNKITNSVWYKYTPGATESISVDTQGSTNSVGGDLDTFLAVWTLSGSTYNLVTCNDDDFTGNTSSLSFIGSSGVTYYFETGDYNCYVGSTCNHDTGGNLTFHVNITNTDVYIGTNKQASYYLYNTYTVAGTYPSVANGPVKVTSPTGRNIFTSQRAIFGNSFNELSGFPNNQLRTDYWFTYYDDIYMSTWLMIGNPDPVNSAHVEVYLGSNPTPIYTVDLAHGQSVLPRFHVAGGPLRVKSTNGVNIFTSQRAAYLGSFNELMGFPANQLTTDYWFTYYDDNNSYMSTWLMLGNPDPVNSAHVEVYLGSNPTPIYTVDLAHGQSVLPRLHVTGGPLRVKSTNGVNIFTSERSAFGNSFNELMGFPANQLTTDYWYTYYDDVNMSTWLMIGNPDPVNSAHVEVYMGNNPTPIQTYDLAHGQSVLPRLGIVGGPVRVKSTNGVNIFTSERVAYGNSFNELMGFPANQLTTDYWFTYYDDIYMSTYLMIGAP